MRLPNSSAFSREERHPPVKMHQPWKNFRLPVAGILPALLFLAAAILTAPLAVYAEDFDWGDVLGYSFVTPVKNQGSSGMCWAFGAVGMLEAKYKITRNDPTFNLDLSELQLAAAGIGSYKEGGNTDNCTGYFQSTGLVTESDYPWSGSDNPDDWPDWSAVSLQISSGQIGTCKTTSSRNWIYESAEQIKADLKNYGPIAVQIQVYNDWYDPSPGSYAGYHEVVITGFHDDESLSGGDYFIVKNSWSNTWNGDGYAKILYSTLAYNRDLCMITSGAYFTKALQTVTWDTSTSSGYQPGGGTWSTSGTSWSADGATLSTWRNGEDAAVFEGGGETYTVDVDYNVSAHAVTFNSGASGYSFSGGALTVTNGGMTVNENVAMNTGITVGAAQTWTIAGGKTLTASNINTHISALTVNCAGNMIVNGAIRDVRSDSRWDGLLTSSSGSLTKSGAGTLTFRGNNTYTGDTAITQGTITLGETVAGLSEGRIDTYFNTTTSNPAASIQLGARMGNTSIGANQTYVYTGYINNSGESDVLWTFAEYYNDAVYLKIDGNLVINDTYWTIQSSGSYTLTPGLHTFELRIGGGSTPNGVVGTGVDGTGLGIAFDTHDGNGYRELVDPGDGSLFRLSNTPGGSMSPYSTVVMSSNTTLDLNNYSTTVGALANASGSPTGHRVLIGSATLTVGGNDKSTTFSGVISGTGGLVKIGAGTQILTGANTYEGGTTFNGGYIGVSSLTPLGPGSLTFNGGGLKFYGSFDPTARSLTIDSGGAAFDTNSYTINFYNPLSGAGGVTKAGNGTLYFQAANTYAGDTAITGGTLKTVAANALPGGAGYGNVSVASGATLDLAGVSQSINGLSGLGTVNNSLSGSVTLTVGGNNATSTFDGKLQNSAGVLGINKIGSGALTLTGVNTYSGTTTIAEGTLKIGSPVTVTHRWSFNNSLVDSVGGSNAAIIEVGANNVTLSSTQATLAGGTRSDSDYIRLGSNLLPDTNQPIAIELWATTNGLKSWSRIFDFGSGTSENLFMSWTKASNQSMDRVEWKDGATNTSDNTNQPYTLGTEFHIVMVLNPVGDSTQVTWYSASSASANLGSAQGTFTSTNTLADFLDSEDNLGRSFYDSDNTANASYNEVRFWSGMINTTILETLHDAGPDADLDSLNIGGTLPSATNVNITGSGATLDLNNYSQTIGSLSGVAGSNVLLGSATLTLGGNNTSTTFSGAISGSGGIAKKGSGTFTLAGENSYAGATSINSGVLEVQNPSALGDTTAGTSVENGASLLISQSLTIGDESLSLNGLGSGNGALHIGGASAVSYGGAINLAAAASIKLDADSSLSLTSAAGISGSNTDLTFFTESGATATLNGDLDLADGSLIKNSSGALILNGNVLSVGATSIADGVLQINSLSASMHDITGSGSLIVGDGAVAAQLTADLIAVSSLTVGAGAKITLNLLGSGGMLSGFSQLQEVPEPSAWLLLALGTALLTLYRQKRRE
jgi:fibronectin-binding autotransporter adhesin